MNKTEPLSDVIKRLRSKMKLSQEGLARELALSWKTIARYEQGAPISADSTIRLVEFCERNGVEEFAVPFRRHYFSQLSEEGVRRAIAASFELESATTLLALTADDAKDQRLEEILRFVVDSLFIARKHLEAVLPLRSPLESSEYETSVAEVWTDEEKQLFVIPATDEGQEGQYDRARKGVEMVKRFRSYFSD